MPMAGWRYDGTIAVDLDETCTHSLDAVAAKRTWPTDDATSSIGSGSLMSTWPAGSVRGGNPIVKSPHSMESSCAGAFAALRCDQARWSSAAARIADEIRKKEGCPEDIGEKIDDFIKTLLKDEILVGSPDDGGAGEPAVIGDEAYADGFELTVDAYAEAQDLILADPVHEVDVSMGWPVMKEE